MAKIKSKEESLKARLGSDLKFPINGNFKPVEGVDLLIQDISQLLLTMPGERVFRPEFGSLLSNQIWENMDEAADNGASAIRGALEQLEPRITVQDVTSTRNDNTGLIIFNITFLINDTDESLSLIFPFRTGSQLSFA